MKKNTVLAITLSSLVILASMFIQQKYFPEEKADVQNTENTKEGGAKDSGDNLPSSIFTSNKDAMFKSVTHSNVTEKIYHLETPLISASFTNKGGDVISYKLKQYKETGGDEGVEMVKNINAQNRAFSLALNAVNAPALDSLFEVKERNTNNGKAIAFISYLKDINEKKDENDEDAPEYRIVKEYEFFDDDYMFSLSITIEALQKKASIEDISYSLRTSPQIGPEWMTGDRYEYRKFSSYSNGSVKNIKMGDGEEKTEADVSQWVAVSGKYFALAVLPEKPIQNTTYSMLRPENAPLYNSQIFITSPASKGNKKVDLYRIYIGPASEKFLNKYNVINNNAHGLSDVQINRIAASGILWPLELLLKFALENINKLTQNWGVSILIMTLIMRLLFFPLTKKSSKATRKMQEMQPKIKEIQEKYKGNPQRINTEMTRLYQTAGYSPLSGCLPMLIQIPFLFAMFALFNNYFEFRGALFIPGWIPDLSSGDSVWKFGQALPFLGWTDLRVLPIIYVASQLIFGKVTQTGPQDDSNPTMRMMIYFMPLFFFFIFYNAPSGLLLFWTASNILMLIQQIIINKTYDKEEKKRKHKA